MKNNTNTNTNNQEDHQNTSDRHGNGDLGRDLDNQKLSSSSSYIYRRIDTIEDLQASEKEGKCHPDPQLKLVDSFSSSSSISSSSGSGSGDTNQNDNDNEVNTTEIAPPSMSASTENQECEMLLLHQYSSSPATTSSNTKNIIHQDSNMSSLTATTASTMDSDSRITVTDDDNDSDSDHCEGDNKNHSSTINRKGRRCFTKKILNKNKDKSQAAILRARERERKLKEAEEELAKRAQKRQMTSTQELWNALTMLVSPAYCIHFCLTSLWLTQSDISSVSSYFFDQGVDTNGDDLSSFYSSSEQQQYLKQQQIMNEWASSSEAASCIHSSFLPNLHSLPPPTVIILTIAVSLHAPCSMYYHLLCAYKLPPGPKRMDHWARRLDQAMIHFMSFMYAYGTTANTDYLLVAMAFNVDCMYRLFQKGMRPRQTLYRMILAFLVPIFPLLIRGDVLEFLQLVTIYTLSGWLFSSYPFGGWSHCVFHFVVALSNPILLRSSLYLDTHVVRDSIDLAAKCAFAEQNGYGLTDDFATDLAI